MEMSEKTGRFLLHACCAPCAEYPVFDLISQGIRPDILYYNPNIHPLFEFERRKEQVKKLGSLYNVSCFYIDDFRMDDYLSKVWEGKYESRCDMCYQIRLDYVARYASEHGYDAFSTSLLVSPYQQHDKIVKIAYSCAEKYNVRFAYTDWRPHFREGQEMAKNHELYRQKYCGCIYSLMDSKFKEKIIASFPEDWEVSR